MSERIYHLTINERAYKVALDSIQGDVAKMTCNDKQFEIKLDELERLNAPKPKSTVARTAAAPVAAPAPVAAGGAGTVAAPIPGAIMSLKVAEGDTVKAGQPVLVMEAMKMENEINATSDGVVTKIHVKPGDNVAQGQPLLDVG